MSGTAILCSGQGAQGAGMFDLLADAPEAAAVFAAATRSLGGRDPRDLVRQSTDAALHANGAGQILCCTQALAAWAAIGASVPRPLVIAGYSVGELAAWGVAGVLDVADVLDLAVTRAAVMDRDVGRSSGLAAIRGLSRGALEPICRAHGCSIAIVNAPDQMLVGGLRAALPLVIHDAEARGAQAAMLPVAVASHTPLLTAASEAFGAALGTVSARPLAPDVRLLSGIDGAPVFDVRDGRDKLARQIKQPIDWAACMDACRAAGVTKVIELGPGHALVRLMRGVMPDGDVHGVSEFRTLAGLTHWIEGDRV